MIDRGRPSICRPKAKVFVTDTSESLTGAEHLQLLRLLDLVAVSNFKTSIADDIALWPVIRDKICRCDKVLLQIRREAK